MTALFPAASQHFATVLGRHALEETVHALAAAIVRLVGPLHEIPLMTEESEKLRAPGRQPLSIARARAERQGRFSGESYSGFT